MPANIFETIEAYRYGRALLARFETNMRTKQHHCEDELTAISLDYTTTVYLRLHWSGGCLLIGVDTTTFQYDYNGFYSIDDVKHSRAEWERKLALEIAKIN